MQESSPKVFEEKLLRYWIWFLASGIAGGEETMLRMSISIASVLKQLRAYWQLHPRLLMHCPGLGEVCTSVEGTVQKEGSSLSFEQIAQCNAKSGPE